MRATGESVCYLIFVVLGSACLASRYSPSPQSLFATAFSSLRKPLTPVVDVAAEALAPLEGDDDKSNDGTHLPRSSSLDSRRRVPRQAQQGDGQAGRCRRLVEHSSGGSGGSHPQQLCRLQASLPVQPSLRRHNRRLRMKTLSTSPSLLLKRQSKAPKPCSSCYHRLHFQTIVQEPLTYLHLQGLMPAVRVALAKTKLQADARCHHRGRP
jgi:hypothetical protein